MYKYLNFFDKKGEYCNFEYLEASEAFENSKINYKLDARGEQSPKRHGGFDLKIQLQ